MYHQMNTLKETVETNQEKYFKAIGQKDEGYLQKLDWLKKKWDPNRDSVPARLICPLLYLPVSPFSHAIIADNLAYFQENYKKDELGNPDETLAIACLCGSQKIAEFLLKELELNYLSPDQEYILGYVAASMNHQWAEDIAKIMAKAGRPIPESVEDFGSDEMINRLNKIFNSSTTRGVDKLF